MPKDKVVIGVIIGLLADGLKLISNYIMFKLDFTKVVFWQITASNFLEKKDLFKPIAYFIGAVADITVTSFLGIIFVFFITYAGKNYLYIKSIGYGLFIWVALFGTLLTQEVQQKLPQSPSGIVVTIIAHLVYGFGFALFTSLLYEEQLLENK
jgi:hypothetical protein